MICAVKKSFLFVARCAYIMAVTFSVGYLAVHWGRRTAWYKDHLYQQLVRGDAERRLYAAGALALVGGERQLLEGLKAEEPEVHDMARRGLEHLWSNAAGRKAYEMMEAAAQAIDKEEFKEALQILDRLTAKYPQYAEAWSQRASVLWQTERYEEAMNDCGRALELNPNHYGAWLGLGICHLQMGDVAEACRSLRAALEIAPHDEAARKSLERCEEFLRSRAGPHRPTGRSDLL
jgi:tetratricopeptide (TPR) repeat protein